MNPIGDGRSLTTEELFWLARRGTRAVVANSLKELEARMAVSEQENKAAAVMIESLSNRILGLGGKV